MENSFKFDEDAEHASIPQNYRTTAFILAIVLIIIVIAGIAAALIIPAVINKTGDENEYTAARKNVLSALSEAARQISIQGDIKNASDAQDFVENYLKKHIQIVKTCENDNLRDCGIETDENGILSLAGTKITMPATFRELNPNMLVYSDTINANSKSYGFVMSNGYSVNIFYNPNCLSDNKTANHNGQDRVCVNAIYDMNGLSQPNQVGKDIGFVTIIYPNLESTAVAPDVHKSNIKSATFDDARTKCNAKGKEYSVPNRDELLAMAYNGKLIDITSGLYWSSDAISEELAWDQSFSPGCRYISSRSDSDSVRCVRRQVD